MTKCTSVRPVPENLSLALFDFRQKPLIRVTRWLVSNDHAKEKARHSRASGSPQEVEMSLIYWIPAFAGMTKSGPDGQKTPAT